jgi:16S rRNA (cytosine967-C5)-methyltransferase
METDELIESFLATHKEFMLQDLHEFDPSKWGELITDRGTLRTLPHHHDGMDAFFAARFVKS